uniref:Cna B-type domain-containing protein n=1 Tax=uncultured Anaerococcus sp. TaxID=293428 RepID=UPI002804E8FC
DVNEETNDFLGINKTGKKEITFYYKDVRLIRVPDGDTSETPKGYVRVTFKAGNNGKLEEGSKAKTVHYDVVKGLKFSNIPVPDTNNSDKTGVKIVPDEGYQFVGWERENAKDKGLLNKADQVCDDYTFVAKFEKPQGKLTIKKVLENQPVEKQSTMARMAVPDPLKFKFKVTGPKINGSKNNEPTEYTEEFELAAGETKVLENLFDGDYKVEEIENHGYTPYYIEGDYDKTSSNLSADPIKVKLEKTDNKKDYEKTLTVVNKNVKPGETENPNKNIIDITVKKVWKGGTKPTTTIELWRKGQGLDGKSIDEKVEEVQDFSTKAGKAGGEDEQSHTFEGLPKHDPSGREFDYYVKEEKVPDNYTKEITVSTDKVFTVTNTYTSPITDEDIIGEKKWVGVPEGTDKPTVKLELWRKTSEDGKAEKAVKEAKNLDDQNQANFGKQDKTDENGVDYIYFVKEVNEKGEEFSHPNYSAKVEGLKVTNTYGVAKKDITATKVWKGDLEKGETRPTIYFKLYRKIEGGEDQAVDGVDAKELSSGTTEVTWKDQDIADDEGNIYTYSVKEVNEKGEDSTPEGYTATYSEDGLTVTNTKNKEVTPTPESKKITVKATKIWKGGTADDYKAVELKLYRTSSKPDSSKDLVEEQYTWEQNGNTITYTWRDLPSKDSEGNKYTYEVVESDAVKGIYTVGENKYLSVVEKDDDKTNDETITFKISNIYQEPQDPKNIVAYKKWIDVPEGEILPKIKFQLQRRIGDETPVDIGDTKPVDGSPDELGFIKVQFDEQEKTDGGGNLYTYSVRELNGDGTSFKDDDYYKHEIINNLTVINTYIKKTPEPEPTPTPTPTPTPEDTPKVPEIPEIPEEPEEPEIPEKPEEPETPETPETPEKPEDKIPEEPEKEIPSVKTDTKKKSDQTGTKFVKQMEQTGTKIVSNVKNFLNPTTGIITNYEIYIGLMAASSVGLFITRYKKNKDDDEE